MHGYPAHAGDGSEFHGDTSGEYSGHETGEQFQHTGQSDSDPVHNTSVMESPSSIGNVEIPSVYDNCANSTTMAGHHRMNQNSPQKGITGHSPIYHQQPGITGQFPTDLHNNLTKQSPIHHQQQQPITSQSPHPHPIQSPHPQPSPHNQQSSPHPQIASPYTSIPHQSPTPQPAYQPTATQPAPRQTSHSSKSLRQPSRTTQQPATNSQLTTQQQVAQQLLRAFQQTNMYYQQFGGVPVASAQARMTGHKAAQRHDTTIFPGAMFPGPMFPACTTAGKQAGYMEASHAQAAQAAQAAAAAAQFYPSPQQHPSHTSSQVRNANSLVRLQHLIQSLDLQPPHGHIPAATPQPVTSPPPAQPQSKSSKSARQSSSATHAPPTLPPGYPRYPPGTLHGAQTMLGNPALVNQMYQGHYDRQRNPGGQMYPSYGPYLNYR